MSEQPQTPISLIDFLRLPDAVRRFVQLKDGQLVPAEPNDPEALEAYQIALDALRTGTVTQLRAGDR